MYYTLSFVVLVIYNAYIPLQRKKKKHCMVHIVLKKKSLSEKHLCFLKLLRVRQH